MVKHPDVPPPVPGPALSGRRCGCRPTGVSAPPSQAVADEHRLVDEGDAEDVVNAVAHRSPQVSDLGRRARFVTASVCLVDSAAGRASETLGEPPPAR